MMVPAVVLRAGHSHKPIARPGAMSTEPPKRFSSAWELNPKNLSDEVETCMQTRRASPGGRRRTEFNRRVNADLARQAIPARCHIRWLRNEFFSVFGARRARRAVSLR